MLYELGYQTSSKTISTTQAEQTALGYLRMKVDVTPIPKGPSASSVANYRPISITSFVICVWASDVGSPQTIYGTQWCAFNHPVCLYQKGELWTHLWCTFLCVPYNPKCIGEWSDGKDSADWPLSSLWVLYKLCTEDIGGSMLSLLTTIFLNQSQPVIVYGCLSKLHGLRCVWRATGKCFGSVIVLPVHLGAFIVSGK